MNGKNQFSALQSEEEDKSDGSTDTHAGDVENLDELFKTIVKTPEELAEETTSPLPPLAKSRNCFSHEEAAQKKNIRQIYPEYYHLYNKRQNLRRQLQKYSNDPEKVKYYEQLLETNMEELQGCVNKPPKSKY